MKILSLLFLISVSASAADFGGAETRPDTYSTMAATYSLYVASKKQSTTFTRYDLAKLAQQNLSQKCSCEVELVTVEKVKTTWVKTNLSSQSSSSKSSVSSSSSVNSTGLSLPIVFQGENYSKMSGIINEPTEDVGGGSNAGSIDKGDWLSYYPVSIPKSGSYSITYRLAALLDGATLDLVDEKTNKIYDSITVPKTGGWQKWINVEKIINLPAGDFYLKIIATNSGSNINWIMIEEIKTQSSSSSVSSKGIPTVEFIPPTKRMNGDLLPPEEIAGYSVKKISANGESLILYFKKEDAKTNSYVLPWLIGRDDSVFIAAVDTDGLYSDYVPIEWKS